MQKLTINSYPKSGGVLFQYMLQTMYPSVKVLDLSGVLFDFENMNKLEEGVVCLIRNPIDSISWAYFKTKMDNAHFPNVVQTTTEDNSTKTLSDFITDYVNFYQDIIDNIDNVTVLTFDNIGVSTLTSEAIKEAFDLDAETIVSKKDATDHLQREYGIGKKPSSEELEVLENKILEDSRYTECLNLYNALKAQAIN
jgi:hypothetical protein